MLKNVDLLIHNAAQLITCASPNRPKRGETLKDVGLLNDGAVAINKGRIVAIGTTAELTGRFQGRQELDAGGRVVCPGFVDPHTHVVYAGERLDEFEQRIRGASYMEIMAAGGGIASTVKKTRAASVAQLVEETRPRLAAMLAQGTTTIEIKTGYGLDVESELKMLAVIEQLAQESPATIVPTFLGAHAVPAEYKGRTDAYVNLVVEEMLPRVASWYGSSIFARQGIPLFNDVFCETNAFDLAQSRRVLEAGMALGLRPKIHAGEFSALGGVALAVELGAVSADHLDVMTSDEIRHLAGSETVGVLLPAVNFNLGSKAFADGRRLIDAGAAVALSTDINPGSAPCPSMPLVMAIATRYLGMLPSEALVAGTVNAAYAIGLGDLVGSLEVGKQADLLVLDAADYRELAYTFGQNLVKTVVKKGKMEI